MVTTNYLMMLGVGTVLGLLLGLANHAAHAYLATPDRWRWEDIPGRSPDPAYRGANYDSDGFWEFASLGNYLYHAGGCLLIVWGLGLWYWDRQELALAQVCGFVGQVGITPLFCM
jgi:hypothetical protein